jgi:FkbM family methyltransferase
MPTTTEALNQGWQMHQAGQIAAAEGIYRQVLQVDPQNAHAWCYLGIACHDQDRWDEAVAAYRQAIRFQPHFPVAFNNLGNTLRMQRRLQDALQCFDQALQQKPDYVNAIKNKGTALTWEGHLDEALAAYRQALELAPEEAETHKNIGVIQLLRGDFDEGWNEYAWRWKTQETSLPEHSQPLWDGSSLDSRTILLTAEQGFGDTIQFVRYARVLKQAYDCRVVMAVPPRLLPLLKTCPGIDQLVPDNEPPPAFDVFSPLLNLPGLLGHRPDSFPADIPYLSADPELVASWKRELADYGGLRVGLMWQGNRQHQADHMRSFPLQQLLPLAHLTGIHWFSLQKGFGIEQLDGLAGRMDIVSLGERLDEHTGAFEETAAVLQNLDLLIACDSSVAHLAGALGVPVWLALYRVPDWRWLLDRDDSPWYPRTRLFRQQKLGDWTGVFQSMADRLLAEQDSVGRRRPEQYRLLTSGPNRLIHGRHGTILINRNDAYIGRSVELYGEFSEGEVELFRQVVRPGSTVVEAGAHIGTHTLVLSECVGPKGAVYAFEPQRPLFQILCGNLALNDRENVLAFCEALGAESGSLVVPRLNYHQENNFGGLGLGSYEHGERVPVRTIDQLELPRCEMIKVDVEGMERVVLQGAEATLQRFHPVLYVENDRPEQSAALIEYLLAAGYRLYWHTPPLYSPNNYFGNAENVFSNIVSVNMLGIHESVKSQITGLREIRDPQTDWKTA